MSRPPRPALPLREGVSASSVAVTPGAWATVLDFLAARLPALPRAEWAARLAAGEVLGADGQALHAGAAVRPGQRLHYWRRVTAEPPAPQPEAIVYRDDWLVVADKPHFMPVTPSGPFVQRSLLVRLKRRLGIDTLSPIHRIDRDTAGLVVFAVQPHTRDAYQRLLRQRTVRKVYEAVAPHAPALALPRVHASRIAPEADPARFFLSHEVPGTPNSETRIERIAVLPPPPGAANDPQDRPAAALAHYRLHPLSGQRHQLRIHLAALGIPILGDVFYPRVRRAEGEADDTARPLQLLARAIAFDDPITGQRRHFVSARQLAAVQGHWPVVTGPSAHTDPPT